jgi:hypothetical protein
MPRVADETAYYLNGKIPAVALIAQGVRFPGGKWIRVANPSALAWQVEELRLGQETVLVAVKGAPMEKAGRPEVVGTLSTPGSRPPRTGSRPCPALHPARTEPLYTVS